MLPGDGPAIRVRNEVGGHLFTVPAVSHAEGHPTVGQKVKRRDLFGEHDRMVLGDERHAGPEADAPRHRGTSRQGHVGVEGPAVLIGKFVVAGRRWRVTGNRNVGVFGKPDARKPALFNGDGELHRIDGAVSEEQCDSEAHTRDPT